MKNEIWKKITDFPYEISNLGNVRNIRTGKILKQNKDSSGYPQVELFYNNKRKSIRIHRIVAEYFIPNPNNLPQVNHKDENKWNNVVSNLEWCDITYNANYGTRGKRIGEKHKKPVLCVETGEIFKSSEEAALKYNVKKHCIQHSANPKHIQKTTAGYHWEYKEVCYQS